MSDGKAIILNRIREALRDNPAPRPHLSHGTHDNCAETSDKTYREWLSKVGETLDERIELFAIQSEALKTEFHRCPTVQEARDIFSRLAAEGGWKKVATHDAPDIVALLDGSTL